MIQQPSPARDEPVWRALNFHQLLYETWDGEHLLFNPASGHTHVLNDVAFQLLSELDAEPADTLTLAKRHLENPQDLEPLSQHLKQLEMIGLICREHPPA